MRAVVLLALFASLAIAFVAPVITRDDLPVLDDRIVLIVNSDETSTWTAGRNTYFEKMSIKNAKRLMGTKLGSSKRLPHATHPLKAAPASFDSRQQWPQCTTISTIFDQARCGSCWAFGCVEAFQDRLCITSNASFNQALSFEDLVTCDQNDGGCDGGEPSSAWEYAATAGLVTLECSPYTVPTCPPASEPCLNFVPTPACHKTCQANYTVHTWSSDLHYSQRPYSLPTNAAAIAQEIATNGPVEAAFTVYADFVHYTSGVYEHKTGGVLGGHAVKIIGYGNENGTDYWLVANSWTTTWGDQGYFKIKRGVNECGIEDDVVAGIPKA